MIVTDFNGDTWVVTEERPTEHGFGLLLGRPWPQRRGANAATILTPDLVAYLESHRYTFNIANQLPLGATAIKRLRRLLGYHRYLDASAWWEERVDDLAEMTLEQFAAKHARKVSSVERARLALLGRTNRPNGWYLLEPARTILADWPAAAAAQRLGLSCGSVRRLQWAMRAPP